MNDLSLAMVGPKAGYALALAIAFAASLRFLKWAITFGCERFDVSRGHLGRRLQHVELELDAYREVAMLMIGVVAKLDPANPALVAAVQILRTTPPRATIELDELVAGLANIPTKGGSLDEH